MSTHAEDDDDAPEVEEPTSSFAALTLNDDDDDDSEDNDDDTPEPPEPPAAEVEKKPSAAPKKKTKKQKQRAKKAKQKQTDDDFDEAALKDAIAEAQQSTVATTKVVTEKSYLRFDTNRVDGEREMAAKYGLGPKKRPPPKKKQWTPFGPLEPAFGAAPSFREGGVRWTGSDVEVSEDWQRGLEELNFAGAPNDIALLCARRPYHAPTLVAAATLVCQLGSPNLAVPLCRRACSVYTAFQTNKDTEVTPTKRTKPFFEAVYMLGRLASKLGAFETAANLFRGTLRLNVKDDPCGVVLRLPGDLYAAGEDAAILDMASQWPDVPSVGMTGALALKRLQRDKEALTAVKETLLKFPHILLCLVDACRATAYFKDLLTSKKHFQQTTWENYQQRAYAVTALPRAIDVLCITTAKFWKDNLDLLKNGASDLTQYPCTTDELTRMDNLWSSPVLARRYGELDVLGQFAEEIPRLDPEMINSFDAKLLSPEAASREQQRNRQQQQGYRVVQQQRQQEDLPSLLAHLPLEMRRQFEDQLTAGVPPAEVAAQIYDLLS